MSARGTVARTRLLVIVCLCCLSFVHFGSTGGCGEEHVRDVAQPNGCVLGYDLNGIFWVRLPGPGTKHYLVQRAESDPVCREPVWSSVHQRLFYIEGLWERVGMKQLSDAQGKVILDPGSGGTVYGLAVVRNELLVLVRRPKKDSQLVAVDWEKNTTRVVLEMGFNSNQPIQVVDDSHVLIAISEKTGETRHNVVSRVDLRTGEVEKILPLPGAGFFRLAENGDLLVAYCAEAEGFYVGSLTERTLKHLEVSGLPGRHANGFPFCLVGERYIVHWRERDAFWGLGMYALDLETGRGKRLCRHMVHDVSYVPDCSVFEQEE